MHSSSKGQGLSVNTIIITALGLVVLFILGMLFFNKTQAFSKGLESCSAKFGSCDLKTTCEPNNGQIIENTDCEKKAPSKICCIKLNTEQTPAIT